MGTVGSLLAAFLGWIISKFIKKKQESEIEKKYVEARKENIELKSENRGLKKQKELEDLRDKEELEWEEATEDERTEILLRRFNNH